mgnify:CR=1 FL=1
MNKNACMNTCNQEPTGNKQQESFFLQIDISKCHYLVDLDTAAETPREPRYSSNKEDWVTIAYKPFLDASRYGFLFEISERLTDLWTNFVQ